MLEPSQIARIKITLDYISPAVTRRVEVPVSILLSDLHLVIQVAMPWWNYHLYEFRARKLHWGLPDPGGDVFGGPRVLPAKKAALADLIAITGAKTFKYTYDFGDDWVGTYNQNRKDRRRRGGRCVSPAHRGQGTLSARRCRRPARV